MSIRRAGCFCFKGDDQMNEKTKLVLRVVISILVFGSTWVVSNQAAITTGLAIIFVWVIKYLSETYGYKPGKAELTGAVYVVSFLLVIIVNPGILPALPAYHGDIAEIIRAVVVWVREATILLLPYTGAAMTIYNMLLKSIIEELPLLFEKTQEVIQ